jgi:hypothetical protein
MGGIFSYFDSPSEEKGTGFDPFGDDQWEYLNSIGMVYHCEKCNAEIATTMTQMPLLCSQCK